MNELVIDELPKARHPLHCACLLNAPYALMDIRLDGCWRTEERLVSLPHMTEIPRLHGRLIGECSELSSNLR